MTASILRILVGIVSHEIKADLRAVLVEIEDVTKCTVLITHLLHLDVVLTQYCRRYHHRVGHLGVTVLLTSAF